MWTAQIEELIELRTRRVAIEFNSLPVSYSEVLSRWQGDDEFRTWFLTQLANSPWTAFRWETPPITIATASRPFEFVLVDSPGLAAHPDRNAFAEHFRGAANDGVVQFHNLGKDAILIVPCPNGPDTAYGHLAAFVRHAPELQQHSLWKMVGVTMQRRLNSKPVWLSTAGAGVSWLHMRLDDRPKYYSYRPYRETPTSDLRKT
jgi:hypothetical protein